MFIDILAPTGVSIEETVDFARRAEAAGASGVGMPDHLEHGRDGFLALALAARVTSSIALYPAVTNVLTRHPFQLAVLARSMQEIAGSRFKLVIGAGGTTAEHTGQPPASRQRLREAVTSIRALLRGDAVPFGSSPSERIEDPDPPGPPVMLAASGPRAIRLAGEIADGALLFTGISAPIRGLGVELLAEGQALRELAARPFEVTFNTLVSVDDDPEAARERTRRAAFNWLRLKRFDIGLDRIGVRPDIPEAASDLSDDLLATVCEHFFIVGNAADCASKLEALAGDGLDRVLLMPAGGPAGAERVFEVVEAITGGR